MEQGRWDYYRQAVESGKWSGHRDLVNNFLRRFKTLCRRAGIRIYTIHDLRRSCITNWARHLPIHVTQQLAGHSDIHTTQAYYLAVESEDIAKAKRVQTGLMAGIEQIKPTDPKLTHSGQKRCFPQRKCFPGTPQPPEL
jgi:hypothetical protein